MYNFCIFTESKSGKQTIVSNVTETVHQSIGGKNTTDAVRTYLSHFINTLSCCAHRLLGIFKHIIVILQNSPACSGQFNVSLAWEVSTVQSILYCPKNILDLRIKAEPVTA